MTEYAEELVSEDKPPYIGQIRWAIRTIVNREEDRNQHTFYLGVKSYYEWKERVRCMQQWNGVAWVDVETVEEEEE